MFRPLELFIGLRYVRAKRRNQFISFISGVSIVCITISVMALITVMSVMNGFDFQLRSRILGAVADATVASVEPAGMSGWQRALATAHANPHVRGAAPYVDVQAFLQGRGSSGVMMRGIDTKLEPQVSNFNLHMTSGSYDSLAPGSWNILLGNELAMQLGVAVGDKVVAYVPQLRATPFGSVPTLRSFHVTGIYSLGMHDYDANLALIDMQSAEKLSSLAGPTGIRLKLDNLWNAGTVAHQLADRLGDVYQ
jgi:lipoprotein-releasing system permease protein